MKDKFFTKLDWAAFWTATLVTFAVYFYTLGPSVGLEDSGELATAAAHLGVPHPPGYPFWTFCSWLFCKAFSWVTYMGHPTPAWCVSLCSATFGAFAAGFTAMLLCCSGRDFLTGDNEELHSPTPTSNSHYLAFGGGVAGALAFSLSPVEWSQSTIVEIYSLNAFFLMWVFLLTYRWMRKPSDKILWMTAFIFGLGLTNYQVLLFAIVPLALVILMATPGMFRDVFIYLCPVAMTYQILQVGQLNRMSAEMSSDAIAKHLPVLGTAKELVTTPSSTAIALGLILLVGSIVAAAVLMRKGEKERAKKAALYFGGAGAAIIFLSAFVFTSGQYWAGEFETVVAPLIAPWRYAMIAALIAGSIVAAVLASLDDKLDKKLLAISAGLAVLAIVFAATVPQAPELGYKGVAYPWWKSTLMFWGALIALFAMCWFTPKGMAFAIPVAGLHLAGFLLLKHGAMNGLTHPCSWWFCWPIAWNIILLALAWATLPNGRSLAGAAFFTQLGAAFYAYMPIVSDLRNPPMNWGYPRTWEGFKHAIERGQYEAIGLPSFPSAKAFFQFVGTQMRNYFGDVMLQFTDLLVPFAIAPFAIAHLVVKKTQRSLFWKWMAAAFTCFVLMSGLLILLANVKGDIQDGFIQKVKFISSHAMIALWIGYGIIFVGALLVQFLENRKIVKSCNRKIPALYAAAAILIALVFPVYDNFCNDQLVFELGGNEQNGHTFGWQFGAYQLDGAKAINEQLVADEEPLPDPTYPPPMEPQAIFFGGTDPGRFVPTYMIYSAQYRPDVYLITQNALADDTYMSVERDLYGDEIWIPSKEDSAEAFNIYVDEVQRGVRQANGDLQIANGRVQVTGALGVMEINGILTKMMFDHDRLHNAFYVEESYVIPWMYPYLQPHGLIMKINAEKTPYDAKRAAQDADFWDWYVRRLTKDPMYRRDFAGQKSFSKLRAALAGLYNKQGRYREGAQAFREACLLYPISPEAGFRYAQECLLPFRRYDQTLELMDYTDLMDPHNKRTGNLRGYVTRVVQLTQEVERLEAKRRDKNQKFTAQDVMDLATCYYEMGRVQEAARMFQPLADSIRDPQLIRLVAKIFEEAGMTADAEKQLVRYVKLASSDWQAWLDLAKLQFRQQKVQASQQSFLQAYRIDKDSVYARLLKDEELQKLALPLFQRRK